MFFCFFLRFYFYYFLFFSLAVTYMHHSVRKNVSSGAGAKLEANGTSYDVHAPQ